VFLILQNVFLPIKESFWLTKVVSVFIIIYLSFLSFHILNYFVRKKFGKEREVNGENVISETYNSRVLGLLLGICVFIIGLVGVIQALEFNSLLEAGGMLGIIGVFLALTQGSWAPDILSGLIILNSNLVKEGDVIEIENGRKITGIIYKTKIFHTEILNLVNNHRVMIRNAKLRDSLIYNLSKFASAKGLRDSLRFNIGYDVPESRIASMFEAVFKQAEEQGDIQIDFRHPFELRSTDAGDYAVEWTLFFYSRKPEKILRNRHLLISLILRVAAEHEISLATPLLHTGTDQRER
jgi:small-conductance mechanosensitive channel